MVLLLNIPKIFIRNFIKRFLNHQLCLNNNLRTTAFFSLLHRNWKNLGSSNNHSNCTFFFRTFNNETCLFDAVCEIYGSVTTITTARKTMFNNYNIPEKCK